MAGHEQLCSFLSEMRPDYAGCNEPAVNELHNLSGSMVYGEALWLSAQTPNVLLYVDPHKPFNSKDLMPLAVLPLPRKLDKEEDTWIGGPHAVREHFSSITGVRRLWITMKGRDPSTTPSGLTEIVDCLCCKKEFLNANTSSMQLECPGSGSNLREEWAIVRVELPPEKL
jgi:hypothetical protein